MVDEKAFCPVCETEQSIFPFGNSKHPAYASHKAPCGLPATGRFSFPTRGRASGMVVRRTSRRQPSRLRVVTARAADLPPRRSSRRAGRRSRPITRVFQRVDGAQVREEPVGGLNQAPLVPGAAALRTAAEARLDAFHERPDCRPPALHVGRRPVGNDGVGAVQQIARRRFPRTRLAHRHPGALPRGHGPRRGGRHVFGDIGAREAARCGPRFVGERARRCVLASCHA